MYISFLFLVFSDHSEMLRSPWRFVMVWNLSCIAMVVLVATHVLRDQLSFVCSPRASAISISPPLSFLSINISRTKTPTDNHQEEQQQWQPLVSSLIFAHCFAASSTCSPSPTLQRLACEWKGCSRRFEGADAPALLVVSLSLSHSCFSINALPISHQPRPHRSSSAQSQVRQPQMQMG